MIGDKSNPDDSALKIAVRDGVIVGGSVFVISLQVFGYPPTPEAFYVSGLSALAIFFESLVLSLRVKRPPKVPP